MTNFAYLRVSSDQQDIKNQKFGLLEYCNNRNINPIKFVEDTISGKITWKERAIGNILEKAKKSDLIVVSEISRLGRSTLQVLEILEAAAKKEISVHIAKNHIAIDGSIQSTITATVLGLAAQIEREFISSRTKEALAKRKEDGMKLGRPKGQAQLLKLDNYRDEILKYLKKVINKRAISKLIECSPSTLYEWLKRRKLSSN
ncbi:Putative DNA invertase/recombinase (plasmid) [Candidatus Trichorickettsia mobilis]|uniref:recombinase family protein n=1 Tax=Candidatus Trichorickettsia mobilis TaxID=1346319 RepID=UPI002B25C48C|nr:recombinase family protein [Candidatus Trichorickettsia mobilis]WPY01760.1 Putative DNA invertase/recombinase [Candidatus Trichorickettsia mobilis]